MASKYNIQLVSISSLTASLVTTKASHPLNHHHRDSDLSTVSLLRCVHTREASAGLYKHKNIHTSDASDAGEVGFGLASAFASPSLTLGNL